MTIELSRHNLDHLYKYTSSEVAEKIITTKKFRWSSPLLFNDPFDHQTGVSFPFAGQDLAEELNSASMSAIFGENDFRPQHITYYGAVLRQLRSIRERLPRDEILAKMEESCAEVAKDFPKIRDGMNAAITNFLTHSRVLCLTEAADNVVMWSHYANEHKGAVFKLRRLENADHRFLIAQRVDYSDQPVVYLSVKDYVGNLLGATNFDPSVHIWKIAYRKHRDWAYEREWRIHMPLLNEPPGDGVSYLDEPLDLFDAIYLGLRMPDTTRSQIVQLARQHLPEMKIYQARKAADRMHLEFERIG